MSTSAYDYVATRLKNSEIIGASVLICHLDDKRHVVSSFDFSSGDSFKFYKFYSGVHEIDLVNWDATVPPYPVLSEKSKKDSKLFDSLYGMLMTKCDEKGINVVNAETIPNFTKEI